VYDENGGPYGLHNVDPWTGTDQFGVGLPGLTLGGPGAIAALGVANSATSIWIDFAVTDRSTELALYALSSPITVPIPEPATLTLFGSALLLLGGFHLVRRRQRMA
jgi:hypothetical protein